MSDIYVIAGLPPYDGEYELDTDTDPITVLEWGWIKRRAGYLPLSIQPESLGDPELISVFAAMAVHRAGVVETRDIDRFFDRLFAAPFGDTITLIPGDLQEQDDAGPPPSSSASSPSSNGDSSTTGSETSAETPPATGPLSSDTSVSDPAMSVT